MDSTQIHTELYIIVTLTFHGIRVDKDSFFFHGLHHLFQGKKHLQKI
jgi:hypothetical protein